ncbi:unnamed protein product [Urochloa humidicola]
MGSRSLRRGRKGPPDPIDPICTMGRHALPRFNSMGAQWRRQRRRDGAPPPSSFAANNLREGVECDEEIWQSRGTAGTRAQPAEAQLQNHVSTQLARERTETYMTELQDRFCSGRSILAQVHAHI